MSIVSRFSYLQQVGGRILGGWRPGTAAQPRPDLHKLSKNPDMLPDFVRSSPVAMRYLHLLGALDWERFPERNLHETRGRTPIPHAPFAAACLVKLDLGLPYMSQLRQFLVEHPALTWALGFPLNPSSRFSWGFDVDASLPVQRHFNRLLRCIPNQSLQYLLDCTVEAIKTELASEFQSFGQVVSVDTKHILAWVKENNPKAYINGKRFDKEQQPKGDPDCRVGCKRRRNQRSTSEANNPLPTPTTNPKSASTLSVGEFYWGYASGVAATKVPGWGEFVLAELTQTFDRADVSYFMPLMLRVEDRLGFKPLFGALDAAFDAWYVYDYFHHAGGFAAVPLVRKGRNSKRLFNEDGLPLCEAGLPMPLQITYHDRKHSLVPHERGRYVCPLFFPEKQHKVCKVNHDRFPKGGCTSSMPTSIGARIRYHLDRDSQAYADIYKQRTAVERVFSQAMALGIERPKIRNQQAIANLNTLVYVLLNLRSLHKLRRTKTEKRFEMAQS